MIETIAYRLSVNMLERRELVRAFEIACLKEAKVERIPVRPNRPRGPKSLLTNWREDE